MKIAKAAHDRALASLAERCVIAEARVKVAEELGFELEKQRDQAEDRVLELAYSEKRWWMMFWRAQGIGEEKLVQYRIQVFKELEVDARNLLDDVRGTRGFRNAPDGLDWSWPKENALRR
jgi:hypothetical protein